MESFEIQTTKDKYFLSIDRNLVDKATFLKIINRLRIEQLLKKADFKEDIVELGEEITESWWQKNKQRLMGNLQ